jgi:DNA-binding transcriptional LysR family regulator
MNTGLLRAFLEVAKTRHFGHAAENMYLTQSAISSRVKQLEDLIGLPLFTRQRNNILLTPAGERLIPHAENILAACQLALQDVGMPNQQTMQLALGGTSNLWDTFLKSVLPKLADRFPSLYIRTEIDSPQNLTRALLGGRLDVIAVFDPPTNIDFESKKIGELELIMICHQADKSIDDIPAIGHVFVDWGTTFNMQQARLFEEPVAPVLHTGQSHIALEFVLSHGGAAFLPRALVTPYLNKKLLFIVENTSSIFQDVHLAYSKNSVKLPQLKPIIRILEEFGLKSEPTVNFH